MIDNKSITTHHSSISIKHKVEDDVLFITNDEDNIANDENDEKMVHLTK